VGNDDNIETLDYKVVEVRDSIIEIQLYFKDAKSISISEDWDIVSLLFNEEWIIIT
jgi:hypothetical protein